MPAADPADIALWKSPGYHAEFYLFVHEPEIVFQARVNMAYINYPMIQLTFDTVTTGAYTDIKEGMTLLLGSAAGLDDYGRVRVRTNAAGVVSTSTTINIQRASRNVHDGEINVVDNAYITVLDLYQVWSVPSYIDPDAPEITYKDTDKPFTTVYAHRPVCNIGCDALHVVEDIGDTVTVEFGLTPSIVVNPAAATLSYLWTFPDGSTSTDATPEYEFTAPEIGYVTLRVTDNLGGVSYGHRLHACVQKGHANLIKKFQVQSHIQRADGQEVSIRVEQALPYSTYPDGTEILLAMYSRYGNNPGTADNFYGVAGCEQMIFAGFLQEEEFSAGGTDKGFLARTNLLALDVAGRLKNLPAFPVVLVRDAAPDNTWTQLNGLNIDRYVRWLLDQHSTGLTRADFTWSGTGDTYGVQTLGSDGGGLWDQAALRTQAIAYQLTCNKNGQFAMVEDPNLVDDRTSTVIVDIEETDWREYSYRYIRPPRVHWNWGEAIVPSTLDADSGADIQTVFCVAPGSTPGQGLTAATSGEQLATQTELNMREGNRYAARMNSRFGNIEFLLGRYGDIGIDPALMEWITFSNSSITMGQRGRLIDTVRFLPLEINYTYNHSAGIRIPRITMEQDITGLPAEIYFPPSDPGYVPIEIPNYPDQPPVTPIVPLPGAEFGPTQVWGVSRAGEVAFATEINLTAHTFNWLQSVTSGLSGTPMWGLSDPYNYSRKYILTDSGLYTTTNVITLSSTWTLVANNATMYGDAARIGHKMIMSINRQGWMMIASGTNMVAYSLNYGASWTQIAVNGAAAGWSTSNSPATTSLDIAISTQNSSSEGWVYAVTGGSTYSTWRSVNYGVSWGLQGTHALGQGRTPRIHVPHTRIGGAPNANDSSQLIYAQSAGGPTDNGRTIFERSTNAGVSYTDLVFSGNGAGNMWFMSAPAMSPLTAFTDDGGYVFSVGSLSSASVAFSVSRSEDGFDNYTRYQHTEGDFRILANVNGWPYQRDWAIFWSPGVSTYGTTDGFVSYTDDGGVSVYDVTPSFFTGQFCIYVEFDLAAVQ